MDTKLNPPMIEGKIKAQQGDTLYIPFQMNRAVGNADYVGINMIVKSATTNREIGSLYCDKEKYISSFENNECQAQFDKGGIKFDIGQYYKIQLAYKSTKGIIGFYSSSAIFKYTDIENIEIIGLNDGNNNHIYSYTGKVDLSKDPSEKVYSYKFEIKDSNENIVISSGEQLHDSTKDTSTQYQTDEWTIKYPLKVGETYTIQYFIKTINNLERTSPNYNIKSNSYNSNFFDYYNFNTVSNQDSGYVELSLVPKSGIQNTDVKDRQFILLRALGEDGFNSWNQMTEFVLDEVKTIVYKDYSISQGIVYKYGIQEYNNDTKIYSNVMETKTSSIFVDFEDMFLSDGKRQLRIKYNPKVSSFKNTILESKMDTLGSKYPFFFRNGNVKYKEFAISGLISTLMDENNEFIHGIEPVKKIRESTPADDDFNSELVGKSNDLSAENFRKEREFKLEVLEWLTNGKPKLFRSPGEGSYIVRLMNTSLSPNDTLGRMIHTFSCTAYEIADYTFDNLKQYGLLMNEKKEVNVDAI